MLFTFYSILIEWVALNLRNLSVSKARSRHKCIVKHPLFIIWRLQSRFLFCFILYRIIMQVWKYIKDAKFNYLSLSGTRKCHIERTFLFIKLPSKLTTWRLIPYLILLYKTTWAKLLLKLKWLRLVIVIYLEYFA